MRYRPGLAGGVDLDRIALHQVIAIVPPRGRAVGAEIEAEAGEGELGVGLVIGRVDAGAEVLDRAELAVRATRQR